ncbi:MAG: SDR family oxidoreductase [Nitriliruptorales bacterium]
MTRLPSTWRPRVSLAWPAMATGFVRVTMRTVDLIVVGIVIGAGGVAAVGVSDAAMRVVLMGALGLSAGTMATVSQRTGAGDRAGAMVVTSSQLSEAVRPGMSHYCAAKGAIRQLVRAAAVDLAPHGIRVNAVAPGPTVTEANRDLFARPEVREANERLIPLGRLGEPREMVGAVLYLLSDAASYTTGATLFVDGGYTVV